MEEVNWNEVEKIIMEMSKQEAAREHKQTVDPSKKYCTCRKYVQTEQSTRPTQDTDFREYFKNNPTKIESTEINSDECTFFVRSKEEFVQELSFYEKDYTDKVNQLRNELEVLNRIYCYTTHLLPEEILYKLTNEKEIENAYNKGYEDGIKVGKQEQTAKTNAVKTYLTDVINYL